MKLYASIPFTLRYKSYSSDPLSKIWVIPRSDSLVCCRNSCVFLSIQQIFAFIIISLGVSAEFILVLMTIKATLILFVSSFNSSLVQKLITMSSIPVYAEAEEVKALVRDTTKVPGKDYVIVDVRGDDYKVNSAMFFLSIKVCCQPQSFFIGWPYSWCYQCTFWWNVR